jgi:hypothetical protein
MRIPTEQGASASKGGVGIFPVPSMSYWELSVRGDPNGRFKGSNLYFKVKSAKFGDGRVVKITNQMGSTNFYTPLEGSLMTINSYLTGVQGQRFFFVAPSTLEKANKLEADHNNESNKLYLTFSIHKKVDWNPEPEPVFRGGGGYRGIAKGATRGSYNGGSNFAASGNSSNVSTRRVNATFPEIEEISAIIQLVNNEPEEELIHVTKVIQEQVDGEKQRKIDALLKQKEMIDIQIQELMGTESARSTVFGQTDQESLLLNCE